MGDCDGTGTSLGWTPLSVSPSGRCATRACRQLGQASVRRGVDRPRHEVDESGSLADPEVNGVDVGSRLGCRCHPPRPRSSGGL